MVYFLRTICFLWLGETIRLSTAFVSPLESCRLPRSKIHPISYNSRLSSTASAISSNQDLLPGIEAIISQNHEFCGKLEAITKQPFFRLYSCDMLGSCEYLPQELTECYSETCEIYPIDEDDVPGYIQTVDAHEHDFEIDGWGRWDMPSEDYYDTLQFPEDYTGYDGSEVWRFIHNRICFEGYEYDDDHWKADYNKAVSGLHSMISAQIVRGIKTRIERGEDFSDEEVWTDPEKEFRRRLSPDGETSLAIENLYFCYMLCLAAASKARDRLLEDCATGKIDAETANELRPILESPLLENPLVEVASQKLHDHAVKDFDSKGALWEARMRTRELCRIMNCVQCNKCRFHGKIGTMGFSTAMQILVGNFGEGGDTFRVHRVELAALMTTLHKFARAVETCQEYLN